MSIRVPLRFFAAEELVRTGEPVTVGLPWPRGAVMNDLLFRLIGPNGEQPVQTKVLDSWPDGSVRWCLFDFRVDGTEGYAISVADENRAEPTIEDDGAGDKIIQQLLTGLKVSPGGPRHFGAADLTWMAHTVGRFRCQTQCLEGIKDGPGFAGYVDTFPGLNIANVTLCVWNSTSADHPGGNWDLGNGGSLYLDSLALTFPAKGTAFLSPERGVPFTEADNVAVEQFASGGANWNGENHLDRHRKIPMPRNGYTSTTGDGLRATPIVGVRGGVTIAPESFWENFPQKLSAGPDGVRYDLLPKGDTPHELQGGEEKTWRFRIAFDDADPRWMRSPLTCHADPEWYAASGAIPYLTPKSTDPNAAYLALADQAITGPDTFFDKREKIDEYGWRNFGDIYGDHEAVHHPGPAPMVSHYNNQYDCVAAFLIQFLRSGDPKWWDLAIPCADHTTDIDIYHTTQDKAAYNGGLFWHTYHYAPADTGTHRSYPRSLKRGPQESQTAKMDQLGATAEKLKKAYAVGGGPASSHVYNAGLMLAYFLTGNPSYYGAAVDLAYFVVRMEDPNATPFRFLSFKPTGAATESGGGGYHGPGRASANSVIALIVGHQLTKDESLLAKAEEFIRRVASPSQNLESLDLLNAELRWFYTMFLQALGRYLDYKFELGQLDRMYAYARLTLLHYARWMAAHERPILDTPEKLQYPTETWAAQDLRKVEVFQFAAKHTTGDEKAKFLERAEFFFRYVERTLPTFETKSLCRPVVLCCKYGWSRAWWMQNPTASAPEPTVAVTPDEFGPWTMFVGQKQVAMKRAKGIVAAGGLVFMAACAVGLAYLLGAFR